MAMSARVTNANGRIVAEKRNGQRRYHQHDALGNTIALINDVGTGPTCAYMVQAECLLKICKTECKLTWKDFDKPYKECKSKAKGCLS